MIFRAVLHSPERGWRATSFTIPENYCESVRQAAAQKSREILFQERHLDPNTVLFNLEKTEYLRSDPEGWVRSRSLLPVV